MEKQELEKLYMNEMSQQKLYKLFGLRKVNSIQSLEEWLTKAKDEVLSERELIVVNTFHNILLKNIEEWNENELSLGFLGPIMNIIDFKIPYKLGFFAQRTLSGVVDNYEIIGKPDGMLAGGNFEPEEPYFAFQEYKKDINSSGDPAGQNLAAMLVGQAYNKEDDLIYGCYVVGRLWYFMVLKGKEFAISRDFSATQDDDILEIVKILKALRTILVKKLGIVE